MQALIEAAGAATARGSVDPADRRSRGRAHARTPARRGPRGSRRRSASVRKDPRRERPADDLAILYLTSGATGEPKMGLVTHRRPGRQCRHGARRAAGLYPTDCTIGFLPSAHIAQRVVIELLAHRHGSAGLVFRKPRQAAERNENHPPHFSAGAAAGVGTHFRQHQRRDQETRRRFPGGCSMARWDWAPKSSRLREAGKPVPKWMQTSLKLAERLVFSKIRARLGGRLRIAASGAAPLGKELARFYAAIGMPLIEGYGLTEGGVACLNPLDRPKSGSIGIALPGVELRLAEDGELLIKSATLFSGYYKDPASTAAVLRDGLALHRRYRRDRFRRLRLHHRPQEGTDRFLQRQEDLSGAHRRPFQNRAHCQSGGSDRRSASVCHRASHRERHQRGNAEGMEAFSGASRVKSPSRRRCWPKSRRPWRASTSSSRPFEQIRKFRVLERDFSIETGELTPTMKVRRNRVLENHRRAGQRIVHGQRGEPVTGLRMNHVPPVAKTVPKEIILHDHTRIDNYFWLRERTDPDVNAYLEAENRYTEQVMAPTKPLQEKLYQEILGRINETDLSVPVETRRLFLLHAHRRGQSLLASSCRKHLSLDAPEEIIAGRQCAGRGPEVFPARQFRGQSGSSLAGLFHRHGGRRSLHHLREGSGDRRAAAGPNHEHVLHASTGPTTIARSSIPSSMPRGGPIAFFAMNWERHRDTLVYQEDDGRFALGIAKTRSRRFLFLQLSSALTSEVRYLDAGSPRGEFQMVLERRQGIEYDATHHGDHFYIRTNEGAKNFRLMRTLVSHPSRDNWEEVIPARPSVTIEDVDAFEDYIVISERERGLEKICIRDGAGALLHYIDFPEPVYTVGTIGNAEYVTKTLRFIYTSLVTPASVYDYNMDTRERELKKQYEVKGGYDP